MTNNFKIVLQKQWKETTVIILTCISWSIMGDFLSIQKSLYPMHYAVVFNYIPINIAFLHIVSIALDKDNQPLRFEDIMKGVLFPIHILFIALFLIWVMHLTQRLMVLRPVIEILLKYTLSLSCILVLVYKRYVKQPNNHATIKIIFSIVFSSATCFVLILYMRGDTNLPLDFWHSFYNWGRYLCEILYYTNSSVDGVTLYYELPPEWIKIANFDYTGLGLLQLVVINYFLWFKLPIKKTQSEVRF